MTTKYFKVISICGTNVKEQLAATEDEARDKVRVARFQKSFVFAALYEGRLKGEAFEWMVLHRWSRRLKGGPK